MNAKMIENIKASADHLMQVVKDLKNKREDILKAVENIPDANLRKQYMDKFNSSMADLEIKEKEMDKQLNDLHAAKEKMK